MATKYIELHMIQNFAPSCLNRDDTNTPKDCEFGGVRRARISSQCQKRAVRLDFPNYLKEDDLGKRTKNLWEMLAKKLISAGKAQADVDNLMELFIPLIVSKLDGQKTAVLLFLGAGEISKIVDKMLEDWKELTASVKAIAGGKKTEKKKAEEKLKKMVGEYEEFLESGSKAADIALFGRMMAEKPQYSQDASCQVAHAISTHAVSMEWDFYTAVDDLLPEEETGAGMMGVIGYNSACFYRYSLLDVGQLAKNLMGDDKLTKDTVEAFFAASIDAIPSAKQSSFAAHNPPSFVLAVMRESGSPRSLTNAFEKPASPNFKQSLLENSLEKLDVYWGLLNKSYGDKGITRTAFFSLGDFALQNLPDKVKVSGKDELVKVVMDDLKIPKGEK